MAVIGTIGNFYFGKQDEKQKALRIQNLEENNLTLDTELKKALVLAEPPKLNYSSTQPSPYQEGVSNIIIFKATKNEPLGRITFIIQLPINSQSNIIKVWPSLKGGAFQTGDQSMQIAPDKKAAQLTYLPMGAEFTAIEIILSQQSKIQISGNMLEKPCEVDIKKF